MLDFLILVITGAAVGFAVGLTGVGGGSLMTPMLLMFGYPPQVAIGTDLLYAGITKSGGVLVHHKKQSVDWKIVLLLAAGSLPASVVMNFLILDEDFRSSDAYESLLTVTLGVMLIITAIVISLRHRIQRRFDTTQVKGGLLGKVRHKTNISCVILGVLLGVCVTLTSVGAGAIAAAILFILYPRLKSITVVGTDIAHAVPLTLVAGLGYLINGAVDGMLLLALLCGSLPGIWLGAHTGSLLPDKLLRFILVVVLCVLGIKLLIFPGH